MYKTKIENKTVVFEDDYIKIGRKKYSYEEIKVKHSKDNEAFCFDTEAGRIFLPYKQGEKEIFLSYLGQAMTDETDKIQAEKYEKYKKERKKKVILLSVLIVILSSYFILPLQFQAHVNPAISKIVSEKKNMNDTSQAFVRFDGNKAEYILNYSLSAGELAKSNCGSIDDFKYMLKTSYMDKDFCRINAKLLAYRLRKASLNPKVKCTVMIQLNGKTVYSYKNATCTDHEYKKIKEESKELTVKLNTIYFE